VNHLKNNILNDRGFVLLKHSVKIVELIAHMRQYTTLFRTTGE